MAWDNGHVNHCITVAANASTILSKGSKNIMDEEKINRRKESVGADQYEDPRVMSKMAKIMSELAVFERGNDDVCWNCCNPAESTCAKCKIAR